MASYNGNVDLLSLNGAKVLVGIDEKNAQRPYVCIPIDVNEIRVGTYQKNNVNVQVAKLRVHIEPFKDSYKNKIRQSNIERGDTDKSVPTHEMQMSFSTEYVKAVAKAFPKLVEQVKEFSKEKDPEIVNQDFNDENSHLFKAIRTRMNKRIASLYQPQPTQQQAYPQQAYGAASNATAYVPPADGGNDYSSMPGYDDPNSDLPF
ncbi:MAG: hypothetical protein SPF20_03045 [Prevotella sp.]|nr:hypothetical protein [Prevotella sp.]